MKSDHCYWWRVKVYEKVVAILLVVIMMFGTALAVEVDLKSMTNDELVELHGQIEAEMTERDILHMYKANIRLYNSGSPAALGQRRAAGHHRCIS